MTTDMMDVQTLQYPSQLPMVDLVNIRGRFRPFEMLLLQALVPETEPVAVPVQYLDHVPTSVAKYKQVPGQRVHLQTIGH